MLRFISVMGIAIAMVVGFIAISSQMKDDFSVRSSVVDVIKQMKNIASDELQCTTITAKTIARPGNTNNNADNSSEREIEMAPDLELQPVEGEIPEATGSDDADAEDTSPDSGTQTDSDDSNQQITEQLQDSPIADIVQSIGYQIVQPGAIKLTAVFKDISGESGKRRVKAGSQLIILCECESQALSCKIDETNINKKYFPKNIGKSEQAK